MFEIDQQVRYNTRIIGARDRLHLCKVGNRKITLEDGSGWTIDGRQCGAGRSRAGLPYNGARLVAQ